MHLPVRAGTKNPGPSSSDRMLTGCVEEMDAAGPKGGKWVR